MEGMMPMQQQQQQGFPMVQVMQPNMQGMMGMNFGAQMPGGMPIQVWFIYVSHQIFGHQNHWSLMIGMSSLSWFRASRVGWRWACRLPGCSSWVSLSSWAWGARGHSSLWTYRSRWRRSISKALHIHAARIHQNSSLISVCPQKTSGAAAADAGGGPEEKTVWGAETETTPTEQRQTQSEQVNVI